MHATRAAVEEGIVPGGGVALLRASEHLKGLRTKNDDQKTGVEIVRKALSAPAARDRGQRGRGWFGDRRQDPGEGAVLLRLRLPDWRIRQPDLQGIIDPTKVVRVAIQERSFGCGAADHHRSHGGRSAEERTLAAACLRVAAEWAAWAVWISKVQRSGTTIRKARQQCRAFYVWMRSTS